MIDTLVNTQFFPALILGLFTLTFIIQQLFYWIFFFRLGRYRQQEDDSGPMGVSVVICAHNECHHLKKSLPLILEQDYPEFEVLVVNHSSDDDTQYLLTDLEEKYPNLKTILIKEDLNFFSGKKFPLSIGIKSAKHELVLLTDADCSPASKDWIRHMQAAFKSKIEVVLGYGPYNRDSGMLNRVIRYDTAHIAIRYLSFALAGVPYMGVGRNLSYVKQVFYKNNGFISHYRIRPGDDDLFINRVAKKSNTSIALHPGSFTLSDPKKTFGNWIMQKKRHLATSQFYKFKDKLLLGSYAFSLILFYIFFALMLLMNWSVFVVLGLFIIRLAAQYFVFGKCLIKLNEKDLIPYSPLMEILLTLLNAGIWVSNIFYKPVRWK